MGPWEGSPRTRGSTGGRTSSDVFASRASPLPAREVRELCGLTGPEQRTPAPAPTSPPRGVFWRKSPAPDLTPPPPGTPSTKAHSGGARMRQTPSGLALCRHCPRRRPSGIPPSTRPRPTPLYRPDLPPRSRSAPDTVVLRTQGSNTTRGLRDRHVGTCLRAPRKQTRPNRATSAPTPGPKPRGVEKRPQVGEPMADPSEVATSWAPRPPPTTPPSLHFCYCRQNMIRNARNW